MTTIILLCLIFFLASWVQGVTGFGSALVAIPLLSLIIDIKEAVPLCVLASLIITTYMAIQLRKNFDRRKILPLCIGSLPGIFVGSTLLKLVPSDTIKTLLGILLISYALYNIFFSIRQRPISFRWGYLAGFLTGAIGSAFSAGGPPSIIYATLSNWSKDDIKATLTGFFFFNSYLVAMAHLFIGLTTKQVVYHSLYAAPFVLFGTAFGTYCYQFFPRKLYLKIVYIFLVIMGILMII